MQQHQQCWNLKKLRKAETEEADSTAKPDHSQACLAGGLWCGAASHRDETGCRSSKQASKQPSREDVVLKKHSQPPARQVARGSCCAQPQTTPIPVLPPSLRPLIRRCSRFPLARLAQAAARHPKSM